METSTRARFEQLLLPLQNDLFYAALAFARNEPDALDLVQETAFRAYRAFAQYRPGTNFRAWVFTIMRNLHIDLARRRRFEPVSLDGMEGFTPEAAETADAPIDEALPDEMLRAIRALPPGQQLLILFSDVQALPYKEIASILRCPIGTVMSGLHAARKRLREAFARERNSGGR